MNTPVDAQNASYELKGKIQVLGFIQARGVSPLAWTTVRIFPDEGSTRLPSRAFSGTF
jgi:hypothetical protein